MEAALVAPVVSDKKCKMEGEALVAEGAQVPFLKSTTPKCEATRLKDCASDPSQICLYLFIIFPLMTS